MILLLIFNIYCYPLNLRSIEYEDESQVAYLLVNTPSPYELSLCYNTSLADEEGWKPMIEYTAEGQYVSVVLPPEGDYKLYYTFRLVTDEYTSFCQPFNYEEGGYTVISKDYKEKLSKKFIKKKKTKKKNKKEDDKDVVLEWFGIIFVVFIVLCLVSIFFSGSGQL